MIHISAMLAGAEMRAILVAIFLATTVACSSSGGGGGGDGGDVIPEGISFKDEGNREGGGREERTRADVVEQSGDISEAGVPDEDAMALPDDGSGDQPGVDGDGGGSPDHLGDADSGSFDCGLGIADCGSEKDVPKDEPGGGGDASEVIEPADVVEELLPLEANMAEPGLRILGPSGTGSAMVIGASIQVAGVVVGKPDAIMWKNETTGKEGYAQGAPFWLSTKVDLEMGDNTVVVTAQFADTSVTDTVVVTYNPAFMFGGDLQVRPRALFVNAPTDLVFSIDSGMFENVDKDNLQLCECTPDGECITEIHKMLDDGQVSISGDEVALDSVHSWRKKYQVAQAGEVCFRAHALVKAGYLQYSAFSPVACVEVVQHVSQQECETMRQIQVEARQLYNDTLATSDAGAAGAAVLAFLQQKPEVAEMGVSADGFGLWLRFANGILGAFNFGPAGTRAGAGGASGGDGDNGRGCTQEQSAQPIGEEVLLASKSSIVLSPSAGEFGAQDEAQYGKGLLSKSICPTFVVSGPHNGADASLQRFRTMSQDGVIVYTGHGDSYFKQLSPEWRMAYKWRHQLSQELLWTGEPVDCSQMVQESPACAADKPCPAGSECVVTEANKMGKNIAGICIDFKQADLRMGRVVMGPDGYGVLPSFISHYRGRGYPKSLVYLGACRSLWNGTLAMELFAAGAMAIAGYTGYVTTPFAWDAGTSFLTGVLEEMKLTGEALPEGVVTDPQFPGTSLRLFGAPNLNATDSDLINESFETGDLTGWQKSGDGRVITKLGLSLAVEGKFMGVISTGMGYTPQVGEIYQPFCIPEGKTMMSFYWKLASEEFKEWCGSKFQDTFEATVEGDAGLVTFVSATIDALCPPEECQTCGALFEGLVQCDFVGDMGGCWMTTWRKAEQSVAGLVGTGAVTLRFFCTDIGDSVYDTVILLDTIKFQ